MKLLFIADFILASFLYFFLCSFHFQAKVYTHWRCWDLHHSDRASILAKAFTTLRNYFQWPIYFLDYFVI